MSDTLSDWLNDFKKSNPNPEEIISNTTQKDYRLDLFNTVLPAIERQDKFFFRSLSNKDQDDIEPWVLMRWLTSSDNDIDQQYDLVNVNSFVNNYFSFLTPKKSLNIAGHKELQWMLMCLCGRKKRQRRKFIKPPKGVVKDKLEKELSLFFPLLKHSDIELLIAINSKEDFIRFFKENAYDDKTIKEIIDSRFK